MHRKQSDRQEEESFRVINRFARRAGGDDPPRGRKKNGVELITMVDFDGRLVRSDSSNF
jgi:hypothetical protein